MISEKPYFIRAMYDWIVDSGYTPYIQVDANYPNTSVPVEYINNGLVVLNIHTTAVQNLNISNTQINFKARFSGVEKNIFFPTDAVLAIFSKETGEGMPFSVVYPDTKKSESKTNETKNKKNRLKKSHLTLIK